MKERAVTAKIPARLLVLAAIGVTLAAAFGSALPERARSQEHNFAGSLQTNYLWVVSEKDARKQTLDGMTNELSLKLAVDFTDAVSANVKLCYGCHGVELGMAFVDMRVADELSFRVGRFTPAFGDFPLRHDPANHRTADKPLPYDMGRMLRVREYNLGVLPAPYVDQGVEVNGMHWFGSSVQLDYAVHAVGGLRSGQDDLDIDFVQSRSVYYVDNNSEPAIGGRLALTLDLGRNVLMSFGGSALTGHPDPERRNGYVVLGADFSLRVLHFDLRAEYVARRTRLPLGDNPDARFRYGPGDDGQYDDFVLKDGFYVEATTPLGTRVEVVWRFDGLRRIGNVPLFSLLRKRSAVLRYTTGVNFVLDGSVRIKLSGELYDFSDFTDELAFNTGVVAAF